MKKVIKRLVVVVGAVAMAIGVAMPAQAQSVCIEGRVTVVAPAPVGVIDFVVPPEACPGTLPPPA